MRQNTLLYIGGSGLYRTDDFQKFCGPGLDRIQFLQTRIGLRLKICQSAHLWLAASCLHQVSGSQTFSDHVPFVGPVLSARTTLFQEKSMCQISVHDDLGGL